MISTLEDLFDNINNHASTSLRDSGDIMKQYNGNDWKRYVTYSDIRYLKKIIMQNENIELVIICWKKGQTSGVHDHPDKGCLMKVLEGNIQEDVYDNNISSSIIGRISSNILEVNDIGYQESNTKLHNIISPYCDSVSLHIYSPAKHKTKYY